MTYNDAQRISHIKQHCLEVQETLEDCGFSYERYLLRGTFRRSISLSIIQIGEHAGKLSEELKHATPERIPWHEIRGMRNWLVHDYLKANLETIWDTATVQIPALLAFCDEIIEANPEAFDFPALPEEDDE